VSWRLAARGVAELVKIGNHQYVNHELSKFHAPPTRGTGCDHVTEARIELTGRMLVGVAVCGAAGPLAPAVGAGGSEGRDDRAVVRRPGFMGAHSAAPISNACSGMPRAMYSRAV
jgi:hypothetical protein